MFTINIRGGEAQDPPRIMIIAIQPRFRNICVSETIVTITRVAMLAPEDEQGYTTATGFLQYSNTKVCVCVGVYLHTCLYTYLYGIYYV